MKITRCAAALGAALVAITVTAVPTHADTLATGASDGQNGTFSANNSSGDHTVSLTGEFAGIASGNSLTEFFLCSATGTPDATSMVMNQCSLSGNVATVSESLPGEVIAAGIATFDLGNLPPGGLQLCGGVTATYPETVLGPQSVQVQTCSPPPLLNPPTIPVQAFISTVETAVEVLLTQALPCPPSTDCGPLVLPPFVLLPPWPLQCPAVVDCAQITIGHP